jgi:hypothetical protein
VSAKTTIDNHKIYDDDDNRITIKQGSLSGVSTAGTISEHIGTGEHAKNSFIWATLKYCFKCGFLLSSFLMLAYLYCVISNGDSDKIDIVGGLKDIWSIFTPILTLALGYAFGKREQKT